MCEDQRPGKLRLAVFHANTMRVDSEDAKKAAKLQGGITQQSAATGSEDATFQRSGVDVESAR